MDLKDLKAIIDLMKKNSITELELERQEFKIRLKRAGGGGLPAGEDMILPAYPAAMGTAVAMASAPLPAPSAQSSDMEIKSPMIGTFYRSPSPEAAAYAEVGAEVNPDTVVCIIEAMKVMNEIKAEREFEVLDILVRNGDPVEYGQPLAVIE